MTSWHQKALILSLAVIALAWTAWQKLEWVQERRWLAAESEVNKRPMLAAGLFLQSQGFSVSRVVDQKRLDQIPDSVDTVFVCEGKGQLSKRHYQELERWLYDGGHLVINSAGGGELKEDEDGELRQANGIRSIAVARLHEQLGVRRGNAAASQDCWHQEVDFEPEAADSSTRETSDVEPVFNTVETGLEDRLDTVFYFGALPDGLAERKTEVEFEASNWLESDAGVDTDWRWQTERGTVLLSQSVGEGRLTVLSDFSPFFNADIGRHDNAFALQSLILGAAPGGARVWFHERELEFPSLLSVLWLRAPMVVITAMMALLLAAWALFARRLEPVADRASTTSHWRQQCLALAAYRWRIKDMQGLSNALHHHLPRSHAEATAEQQAVPLGRSKKILLAQAKAHWRAENKLRGEVQGG